MDTFHCLYLDQVPILDQLRLEEALLRADTRNWCLVNQGSPPAIVMGISGKADRDLDTTQVAQLGIPVIKRYSGGGTVFVDSDTVFVTIIANRSVLPFTCYPRQLMEWSGLLYAPQLEKYGFAVCENDYVLGKRKFGGNAQSITKDRFVHHSTLLWDYSEAGMTLLRFPEKVPNYRGRRSHSDFLCRLKDILSFRESFVNGVMEALGQIFNLQKTTLEDAAQFLDQEHRQATRVVELFEGGYVRS